MQLHTQEHGIVHCIMKNLPVATLLVKNGSPPPGTHQLPIIPQLGMGPHGPLPCLCWNVIWLGLVQAITAQVLESYPIQ